MRWKIKCCITKVKVSYSRFEVILLLLIQKINNQIYERHYFFKSYLHEKSGILSQENNFVPLSIFSSLHQQKHHTLLHLSSQSKVVEQISTHLSICCLALLSRRSILLITLMWGTSNCTIVERADITPEKNFEASTMNCESMRNTPHILKSQLFNASTRRRITGMWVYNSIWPIENDMCSN